MTSGGQARRPLPARAERGVSAGWGGRTGAWLTGRRRRRAGDEAWAGLAADPPGPRPGEWARDVPGWCYDSWRARRPSPERKGDLMMRRSIIALLLGGLIAALAGADQSPTKAQAAFDRLREEMLRETFKVRSVEAAKAVFAKYTKKFLEHAKDHPKDASAAEALMYVVAMFNPDDADKDGPRARALAALRKDHLKAPTIRGQLGQMAMSAVLGREPALANAKEDLAEVVREVAEGHPDRRTRALACRALLASR